MNNFIKKYHYISVPENKSYCLVFKDTDILLRNNTLENINWPTIDEINNLKINITEPLLFGSMGNNKFYYAHTEQIHENNNYKFYNIRNLFGSFNETEFTIASYAYHLSYWDKDSAFCGRCGGINDFIPDERAKRCSVCDRIIYPRISPAVIVAVINNDKILLATNKKFKGSMYSILAGFVEPGETLEDCIHREIKEEVNLEVHNIRYFGSQPWSFPDSLMMGFFADYKSGEILVSEDELTDAKWFGKNDLPNLPLKLSISRKMIDSFINQKT